MSNFPGRLTHLHIPKTAGTSLNRAIQKAFGDDLRLCPYTRQDEFDRGPLEGFNFYSGHFGYITAKKINAPIITVLRDPADRFLSAYYFFRQRFLSGEERSEKTTLAMQYDLDQFVQIRDEPALFQPFDNTMAWQIGYAFTLPYRMELKESNVTETEILRMAIHNVETFAMIGLQDRICEFVARLGHMMGAAIQIETLNVTGERLELSSISHETRKHIERWIELDRALYDHVLHNCSRLL